MDSNELKNLANKLRYMAVEAIFCAGSGHPGGALSSADLITYLYFKEMRVDTQNPHDPDRDRFVFSKGHACPILYAALAEKGFFPKDELKKLRHIDSFLQGHPDLKHTPGIDMSTGSLGQGISAACGIAMAGKKQHKNYRVYTIVGDGEIQEGQFWEALNFAHKYELANLMIILDYNGLQIDGTNEEVMNIDHLKERFSSFGLNTLEIDGHNFAEIEQAFRQAKNCKDRATIVIAHTVKGKGVSFMENQVGWHGKAPTQDELNRAKAELEVA